MGCMLWLPAYGPTCTLCSAPADVNSGADRVCQSNPVVQSLGCRMLGMYNIWQLLGTAWSWAAVPGLVKARSSGIAKDQTASARLACYGSSAWEFGMLSYASFDWQ